MLRHLSIKDFAVVRATELEFGPGMTVVSGETGAGKSLMVDALGFLSGLRADSGVVRHGAPRAELSAEFALEQLAGARRWLADNELDDDEQCQLRRVIRADGGSRAWINGRPVTISQLTELAGLLVEIHGQHEQQALLTRPSQLALLDAYASNADQRRAVRVAAAGWQTLVDEAAALSQQGDVSDRIGFLEHQLRELEREELEPESIIALGASHRRQAHASALLTTCDTATTRINGDDDASALGLLAQVRGDLGRMVEHDARLGEVDALIDSASIQLQEALSLLDRVHDDLDADPEQFEDNERRLGRLHDLARKHRVPMEDLAAQRDRMQAEAEQLRGADVRLQKLAGEIEKAAAAWREQAAVLSAGRQRAAAELSTTTTGLIAELGMGGGQFLIQL
ncbi:MAG: AAA family ATPase, partial [Stenotrophomonas sp.]|nr:AAA family ATPase [Stenotrophomonas sp.]